MKYYELKEAKPYATLLISKIQQLDSTLRKVDVSTRPYTDANVVNGLRALLQIVKIVWNLLQTIMIILKRKPLNHWHEAMFGLKQDDFKKLIFQIFENL